MKFRSVILSAVMAFVAPVPTFATEDPAQPGQQDIQLIMQHAQAELKRVNDLVAQLDVRLDDLYDQREAAGADLQKVQNLDTIIDRLNLAITEMESKGIEINDLLESIETLAVEDIDTSTGTAKEN